MKPPPVGDEATALHDEQIVIDLHVDVIVQQRLFRYDIQKRHRPWMRRQPFFWHTDIPRMTEGGYTAAVLGIHYWPWESRWAWKEACQQLDYLRRVCDQDDRVLLAETAQDIETAKMEGKLALMAGLEGAHLLAGDLDRVDEARRRGGLYLTLAHFSRNSAARPALGRGADPDQGLTAFGRDLVDKLNGAEMLVDVAHLNERTVLQVCEFSRAPVIASHTMASALHAHPRGCSDEAIEAIAETGGLVGIIFSPEYLRGSLNAPMDAVVDHIEYVCDLVGSEHVGLGSDFDGWIPSIPNDIRDCRDIRWLTQKLLDRGFGTDAISNILGRNVLRVLRRLRGPAP